MTLGRLTHRAAAVACVLAGACTAAADNLVILHTNDTHSAIDATASHGGILERKALIDSVRQAESNVLLIDAGDIVQGTLYFNNFRGDVEYPLFEMMDYDVRILGNHEFDNGMEELAVHYRQVGAARLSANYDFSGTVLEGVFTPWMVKEIGGKRIGLFGLNVDPAGLIARECYDLTFRDVIPAANETARHLREQEGCDLVIAVTHIGYEPEDGKATDVDLARQSRDIDVIIGGHSHTVVTPGRQGEHPSIVDNAEGRPVLIAQTGKYGRNLGYISIPLDQLGSVDAEAYTYRLLPVPPKVAPERIDRRMADFIRPYREKVDSVNRHVVAQSLYSLTNDSPTSGLANLTGDFALWYASLVADSIGGFEGRRPDLGFMNVGSIRQPMPAGDVTEGQILSTYPFSNRMVALELKGSDLLEALDVAARRGGESVSGNLRVVTRDGHVDNAYLNLKPIDPDATYIVATIDYVAAGNDYLFTMANGRVVWQDDKMMWAPMMRYVTEHTKAGLPLAPDLAPRFMERLPVKTE